MPNPLYCVCNFAASLKLLPKQNVSKKRHPFLRPTGLDFPSPGQGNLCDWTYRTCGSASLLCPSSSPVGPPLIQSMARWRNGSKHTLVGSLILLVLASQTFNTVSLTCNLLFETILLNVSALGRVPLKQTLRHGFTCLGLPEDVCPGQLDGAGRRQAWGVVRRAQCQAQDPAWWEFCPECE